LIINRYIIKEASSTLFAVLFVLLLIYVSNRFVQFLTDAMSDAFSADVLLTLLGLKTLSNMIIILPLALFIALLMTLGRLYRDNEMVAMMACGMSIRRVYVAVMGFALVITVLMGSFSLFIVPWAEEKSYQLLDQAQSRSEASGVVAGRFMESGSGDSVFYTERFNKEGDGLQTVFLYTQQDGKDIIIAAPRGRLTFDEHQGQRTLTLNNGYRYEGFDSDRFTVMSYEEYVTKVPDQVVDPSYRRLRAHTTASLWGKGHEEMAELQWRLSIPLSVLMLAMLAVPLSRVNPREGKYGRLFVAILIYLIYSNLMSVANTWLGQGLVSAYVGMWWVHLLMLLGIFLLLAKQYGLLWLVQSLLGQTKSR